MISIGILTHNNLASTKKCIEKIYENTENRFLLFIFDNGSTDGTREYLSSFKYKNVIAIKSDRNIGVIRGRNFIYDFSKSYDYDYICFLDNDQFVQNDWDTAYLSLMNTYDIVGKEAWQMRKDFTPFRRIKNEMEHFNYVGCGGMMIKKEVIDDLGLFDINLDMKYFEDPDFCFRAYNKGYKIGWCKDNVIIHQKHDLTLSKKEKTFFLKNLKVIQNKWREFSLPKII